MPCRLSKAFSFAFSFATIYSFAIEVKQTQRTRFSAASLRGLLET